MKNIKNIPTKIFFYILFVAFAFSEIGTVGKAGAYFSDSVAKSGNGSISLSHSIVTHEEIESGKDKVITVENTGNTDAIIKVLIVYPEGAVTIGKESDSASFDWVLKEDGWYYYKKVLKAGETSSSIMASVGVDAPSYEFDITVMTASERVIYNEDGSIKMPLDWVYVPTGGDQ